ncbi:MAG: ATP-dependent protease LonB [Candidatus Woesearchaeota archaeon]|nr:MAG: ATP-dependent protease LonB [Candidatus Woesearchaeota archaeon]
MMKELEFKNTGDIKAPEILVDQVIGQFEAVNIIKKVSKQRRNVLLIGEPGTGKSMIGQALSELLPKEKLKDILSLSNQQDDNTPLIKAVAPGKGKEIIELARLQGVNAARNQNILFFILLIIAVISPWWIFNHYNTVYGSTVAAILSAASMIGTMVFLVGFVIFVNIGKRMKANELLTPKLIVDNQNTKKTPFIDATGSHAGALLGDVLHDPLQSGGLGTPAYQRVVAGMIHRANGGVLFIDEIATLSPRSQQELLTAMQEKRYPITGQSERSSGAMVRTEPVPTDFVLVAAGNLETVKHMHPALRSRIRGYGYEVYMNDVMDDTVENRNALIKFVAQEVRKDTKIPHFSRDAVMEIIEEARRRAGRSGKLTVRLRGLGGLIRAAGDLALEEGYNLVEVKHIIKARILARPLEQQIADKYIESKKAYAVILSEGKQVGRVNGLAVIGDASAYSGIVLPIEAAVTPGGEKTEIIATGRLGKIAKEAVKNVSAIIMNYFGEDIREKHNIYVQFLQTHEGVEGDSASIAVATAIMSALKNVPIKQNTAMTGSLSIRGEVLAIGGVSSKIEAAMEAGIKRVIIPKANEKDVIISKENKSKVEIVPVNRIEEVWEEALDWKGKEKVLETLVSKSKILKR